MVWQTCITVCRPRTYGMGHYIVLLHCLRETYTWYKVLAPKLNPEALQTQVDWAVTFVHLQ